MQGGCARVNNILGTSRGIGDIYLKSLVIPDPDVRTHELRPGDDFAVVATDGLWDVLTTSEVCTLALQAGEAKKAARDLTEAAIRKGAEDNVSVIVIDLRCV
jgi:serine/threonine protein phosphatase PrpC